MTTTPHFRVSKVFPADNPLRVAQVRLLLASRALTAIGRILESVPDTAAGNESQLYFLALSIGAANEAAIAFMAADAAGAFEEILEVGWAEMDDRIRRLRIECDEKNPESLRKKLILINRNTLSFHWNNKIIARALKRLEETDLPAWGGGEDKTPVTTAYPVVTATIQNALEAQAGSKEALDTLVAKLASVQGDLFHLAGGVYTIALRKAQALEG